MRIALLVPSLDRKGPVIVARNLCRHLKDKVEAVDVYYFNDGPALDFPVAARRIGLFQRIDHDSYDIVHSHMMKPDVYVWKMGRRRRCRTVSTVHQFTRDNLAADFSGPVSAVVTPVWNRILGGHDCLVYISRSVMEHSRAVIANPRCRCIHNGIEPVALDAPVPPEDEARIRALKGGRRLVGNFSQLTRRKGVDQLVGLLAVDPGAALLVIGGGKELPGLVSLARSRGVEDRCLFLGARDNVDGYFRFLDVYAMTSRSEAFGLSLVEAASAGVPVVCSDIETFRELFDETEATFFRLENVESLKEATVAAAAEKCGKAARARRRVLENYTAGTMAANYLALYRELAGAGR